MDCFPAKGAEIRLFRDRFKIPARRPLLVKPDKYVLLLWAGSIGRNKAFVA